MNILMVSNEFLPGIGGVQTHVYELSKALVELGHRVLVLTRKGSPELVEGETMAGIEIRRYRLSNSHLIYDFTLSRILKRLIASEGFDVVHVHGMRPLAACKRLGVLVVFTNRTSSFLKRIHKADKMLAKMRRQIEVADVVLAPSDELVEATLATRYGGPAKFISNGVDTARFSPVQSDLRSKLGIPEDAFVAILARRLVGKNGVLFLAEAIASIEDARLHVVVAGNGADRAAFERIIDDAGCRDRVHMLGGVDNTDMPGIFSSGDVSVLPSLMEATSIAGLEATASGLPVIGTNVGDMPVIIDDGVSGILVEPRSPEALAAGLLKLMNDRPLAAAMGKASLERAVSRFSWLTIAEQTLQAYRGEFSNSV